MIVFIGHNTKETIVQILVNIQIFALFGEIRLRLVPPTYIH